MRLTLTLAALAAAATVGALTGVAQATVSGPNHSSFITDTLAPGGTSAPAHGYRFITDTLAPGGTSAPAHGYRFITDTLAPGGGGQSVVALSEADGGFHWGDFGIGAGGTAAVALLGLSLLRTRRTAIAV
ncbi:MAG: hypothetical protein ACJ768_03800 [Gaiellaceae bacterium]